MYQGQNRRMNAMPRQPDRRRPKTMPMGAHGGQQIAGAMSGSRPMGAPGPSAPGAVPRY